jgi:hypothetical protein
MIDAACPFAPCQRGCPYCRRTDADRRITEQRARYLTLALQPTMGDGPINGRDGRSRAQREAERVMGVRIPSA